MTARPIGSVLIAGGGIAGWSIAVALRKRMPELAVAIIDTPPSPNSMIDAVGALLPSARGYHGDVGIAEADLIRTLGASVRLGTMFDGWAHQRASYVHAYGDCGQSIGAAPFHLHWLCAAARGKAVQPFDGYSPAAAMARAARFMPPPDAGHPMSGYEYGLQVDPARYRAMLRGYGAHFGVSGHDGAIAEVRLDPVDGGITEIALADGAALSADLYVDATGPERLLHRALGGEFEDWSRWLFVDRFLTGSLPRSGEPPVLDRVTAHTAGWLWTGGSLAGTQYGFAYAAAAVSDGKAARILRGASTLDAVDAPAVIAPGRVVEPWLRNCVAIGDAAVTCEPLEFTALHLAHSAIDRILAKLPATDFAAVELWDYNRETNAEADRVRDFLVAHYAVADRPSDPLWRAAAAVTLPDSLAHTLALFAERGRLPIHAEETFSRHSWATMLLGQGMIPRRVDPLAKAVPRATGGGHDGAASRFDHRCGRAASPRRCLSAPYSRWSPPMTDHRIRRVVIVGGGTAGWMAAAMCSRLLDRASVSITLVESEEIGIVGVGEATIPPITTFNTMLGLGENQFMEATEATFKVGIEFVNWGHIGERYIHPFGQFGQDLHGVPFHQLFMREREFGGQSSFFDYSICVRAAESGKFARAAPGAKSQIRDLVYAFHFDAVLYGRYLRRYAEANGVHRIEGRIVDAPLDGETGNVASVTLTDGSSIEGDLFLDCSGFRGLLIEQALKTGYEDWGHWLPCDSAVAVPSANVGPLPPYTRSTAHSAGWQWRVPLRHRTGNGHVYSSKHISDDEATATLLSTIPGDPMADPRILRFTAGRRKLAWNKNVIALGLAGGFVEPLESTSIHLVQAGLLRLNALFPDKRFDPTERDEYNRMMQQQFEDVRDFIILHYHATHRDDSSFWNHVRTMDIPASLQARLALWDGKGRCFREGYELFTLPSWTAVLLGQGRYPSGYDPMANALDERKVAAWMEQVRLGIGQTVDQLPTHEAFIDAMRRADQAAQQNPKESQTVFGGWE